MAYVRKTRDVWHIYVNYGQGWEHESTELTRKEMQENRKAYRENCAYPIKVKKVREKIILDSIVPTSSSNEFLKVYAGVSNAPV